LSPPFHESISLDAAPGKCFLGLAIFRRYRTTRGICITTSLSGWQLTARSTMVSPRSMHGAWQQLHRCEARLSCILVQDLGTTQLFLRSWLDQRYGWMPLVLELICMILLVRCS